MTQKHSDCEPQKRDSAFVIRLPFNCYNLECLTKPRYASLEWILAMPSGAPPIGAFAFPEASSK